MRASRRRRLLPCLVGFLLLGLGLLCLNYTKAWTLDHHESWARQRGMPGPSPAIYYAGVVATGLGPALLGFTFAPRRRR